MNTQTKVGGTAGSPFKTRYDNYIGGKFVAPVNGRYMDNVTPITGGVVCEVARSDAADMALALDAAHAAKEAWGKTSAAHRSNILLKIADRIEENLELIATAETWDNGKPIRETVNADIPLSVDHFRYFAGVLRGQEGTMSEIDSDTVAYHFHEPLGVHSVELLDPDGGVEIGPGAGGWQLHRDEAGRTNPGGDHGSDGADRRSAACRCAEHRQRPWCRGG